MPCCLQGERSHRRGRPFVIEYFRPSYEHVPSARMSCFVHSTSIESVVVLNDPHVRYFLMVEGPIASQDSNFSSARVHEVYNTDLCNTLVRWCRLNP
jgi:methionyl-tRNA synthetase